MTAHDIPNTQKYMTAHDIPNTQIHDCSLSLLGTGTSIRGRL